MKTRFLLAALLVSTQLFAAEYSLSKIGTEMKGIKNKNAMGVLFGWRYMHHRSESFSVGGAAYTGQFSGDTTGSFSYGGLVTAFNATLSQSITMELSLTAGGAGGFTSSGLNEGGIVLEPNFNIGYVMGKFVRTSLSAGYIWLPNSKDFSAISGGLRFEFLSE